MLPLLDPKKTLGLRGHEFVPVQHCPDRCKQKHGLLTYLKDESCTFCDTSFVRQDTIFPAVFRREMLFL